MPAAAVVTEVIMEEEKRKRIRHPVLLAVIVTAAVTAALTAVLAAVAVNARLGGELSFAREHPKLRELSDVIDSRFVGEKDAEAVEEACAAAMVEGLGDPWSYYISAEDLKQYDITRTIRWRSSPSRREEGPKRPEFSPEISSPRPTECLSREWYWRKQLLWSRGKRGRTWSWISSAGRRSSR